RELLRSIGQLVLDDVRDDRRRRELGLEVCQVLALVGSEPGDVDESDDVFGRAGRGDHRAAVRMTDEQHGPVDLTDDLLEVFAVAARQATQRIRRGEDRYVFLDQPVVQRAKAGCVSERAVDEDDGWTGHADYPLVVGFRAGSAGAVLPND